MTRKGCPALPPASPQHDEDRAVGYREEVAVGEGAELLQVAEPAPPRPGAAGVRREREPLDPDREARLGELDGEVLAVRHDVDDVGAVGVVAAARAAPEHLAHQVELALRIRPRGSPV